MKFGPAVSAWGWNNIQFFIVDKATDHPLMSEGRGSGLGGLVAARGPGDNLFSREYY